jgi:hypothetical protein
VQPLQQAGQLGTQHRNRHLRMLIHRLGDRSYLSIGLTCAFRTGTLCSTKVHHRSVII